MKKLTIHTDGLEGFRKRPLERAKKLDRGELLEPEKILTFEGTLRRSLELGSACIGKSKRKRSGLSCEV
jgi:hypothetical protein